MLQNDSFSGCVIYIDLRGYTKIVEEKILNNIAQIIYNYQNAITKTINQLYDKDDIAAIEYMGDGVMIIIKQQVDRNYQNIDIAFANNIYKSAKTIKNVVQNILKLEKEKYTNLDRIDFGMAISHSTIYQKNIIDDDKSNSRKMFFGVSLNRAAKIGNKMNSNKNHIGIDKPMYDDFLVNLLVEENMIKGIDPIVHMYSENRTKPSSECIVSLK